MAAASAYSPLLPEHPEDMPMPITASSAAKNSQSPEAATGTSSPPKTAPPQSNPAPNTNNTNITSPIAPKGPRKADTTMSWGVPAGLPVRTNNDENLIIFRKALGINCHALPHPYRDQATTSTDLEDNRNDTTPTLEEGRKTAMGIYRNVIHTQRRMRIQHFLLTTFLYLVYFAQVVIGAALTALGSVAARYERHITILGAFNTVLAGVLALIKGSGQPQKLGKDRVGYRRLQDWIEETEALLAVGVIGRNRKEVGLLVESAFKRYNAAKRSEENNDPDFYVYHKADPSSSSGEGGDGYEGKP
ncbi:hypothetical protein F4808DRAFT_449790 [Astrocystis sublimbata]|nr:hypothetical protein F4808DRAFT_449790 [Astrocystis sublimbata]